MTERAKAVVGTLQAGPRPEAASGSGRGCRSSREPAVIRVALADDQELVRAGLAELLDAEDDIEVAAKAADGREAVRVAEQRRPDVMLMDVRMARTVPGMDELTPREREVVALIAQGLSNEEISGKIYISAATAKTHAARAMTKLGARDRAQLVVFAYQVGLVRPGWS